MKVKYLKKEIVISVVNKITNLIPSTKEINLAGVTSSEVVEMIQNQFYIEIIDDSVTFNSDDELESIFKMVDFSYLSCGNFTFFDLQSIKENDYITYFGDRDVYHLCESKQSKEIILVDPYNENNLWYLAPDIFTFVRILPILCKSNILGYLNQYNSKTGLELYLELEKILVDKKYLEYFEYLK